MPDWKIEKWKLTSDQINDMLYDLDMRDVLPYDAFGGKVVPYIGWFWRPVGFDYHKEYSFGVLPVYDLVLESNADVKIGFMENNKWGYGYCHCPAKDWQEIRHLLETALLDQTHDNFKAVDDKIQSLYTRKR